MAVHQNVSDGNFISYDHTIYAPLSADVAQLQGKDAAEDEDGANPLLYPPAPFTGSAEFEGVLTFVPLNSETFETPPTGPPWLESAETLPKTTAPSGTSSKAGSMDSGKANRDRPRVCFLGAPR